MSVNIGPRIGIDGESEYRKSIQQIIQQSKTLGSEMKAVTASFDSHTSSTKKAKATHEVLSKQVAVQKDRVAALTDMLKKSEKEFGENDTRTLKWKQAVNEASAELANLEKATAKAHTESSKFRTGIKKAGDTLKDFPKHAAKALGSGLKKTVTGGVKLIGGLTAAAGAGVVALGKIGLDYNAEMESYTTNFTTMLGSTEAAVKKVEDLKTMAASTPFAMSDLAGATQQLLAMGVASDETGIYLQQLGDISLGDSAKLGSLVNAFGKMNSTGKVSLEYINMMAEQGFNPLNVIAGQTGETMEQLYDRVSKGNVSFDEIKGAMAAATAEGGQFCGGMEKASHTTKGLMSTLEDNARALVGEVFAPISEGLLSQVLPSAIDAIDQLSTGFKQNGIEGMVDAAGNILGETLGQFSGALPKFVTTATNIVHSLLQGIRDNHGTIADGAVKAIKALIGGFTDMLPDIIVTGVLLLGKLAVGLVQAIPDMVAKVPQIIRSFKNSFTANAPSFREIGRNMIQGLINGIGSMGGALWNAAKNVAHSALNSIKRALGIASPSKVMRDQVGKFIPAGVAVGIEKNTRPVETSMQRLRGMVTGKMRIGTSWGQPATATVGGSRSVSYGGFEFNIYTQPGQDTHAIARDLMEQIRFEVERKEAMAF